MTGFDPRLAGGTVLAFGFMALLLCGCAETGDFGRPKQSVWNDLVLPSAGFVSATVRGEPYSFATLTDDERELRDRSYRFVMPAQDRAFFDALIANMARTRILPPDAVSDDPSAYFRILMSGSFASATSRYRRLSDDILADRGMLASYRAIAGRVVSADRVRAGAMARVPDLTEAELEAAENRIAENIDLIVFVRRMVDVRICQYRYAIDHLAVAAPQADAVPVERNLLALERDATALDQLDIGPLVGGPVRPEAGPWSGAHAACRLSRAPLPQVRIDAPLVRKY